MRNNTSNSLSIYQSVLANTPILSNDQQRDYARKAQQGDMDARDMLINANLRLVYSIVNKYFSYVNMDIDDLVSSGNLGLVKAVNKYDPNSKASFATYATPTIFNEIQMFVEKEGKMIHLPANVIEEIRQVKRTINEFVMEFGYEPDNYDISDYMNNDKFTPSHIQELLVYSLNCDSSDRCISEDGDDSFTYQDCYGDVTDMEYIKNKLQSMDIKSLFAPLDKESREVISRYFGLFGYYEQNYSEISKEMNISSSKVKQIITNGVILMKEYALEVGFIHLA